MRVTVTLSPKYEGQLRFISDDPYFAQNSGLTKEFMQDGTLVNQDMVGSVCNSLSKLYQVEVDNNALPRVIELVDENEPHTPSFIKPFDTFALKGYQKRCLNVLKDEPVCFIQTSAGTGKTIMATFLALMRLDDGRADKVVVFCPSALVYDWLQSLAKTSLVPAATVDKNKDAKKRAEWYYTDTSPIWVLNYERLRTDDAKALTKALRGKRVVFVMDEVQKVKNRTSALHKNLLKLTKAVDTVGKIALTATPIVRGPEDFYNEFRILEPAIFGTVRDFEERFTYNHGERDIFRNYIGYQNLAEMHAMAGSHVFSATKTRPEIAKEFPAKQEVLIQYELSRKMRQLYDEVYRYGKLLDDREGALFMMTFMRVCNMPSVLLNPHAYPNSPYCDQLREIDRICAKYEVAIRDIKENAKLQLVAQKVEEIVDACEKVIVFGQHTHNCLFPLADELARFKPLLYTGETSAEQKEQVKRLFKGSSDHNLLLMSDAGQVGLNFQECGYLIHYQTPTSHAAYEQRSDRISRVDSNFSTIEVIRFAGCDTIEERIEDTMMGRRDMSVTMGFGGEYEEVGAISQSDADFFCGF